MGLASLVTRSGADHQQPGYVLCLLFRFRSARLSSPEAAGLAFAQRSLPADVHSTSADVIPRPL